MLLEKAQEPQNMMHSHPDLHNINTEWTRNLVIMTATLWFEEILQQNSTKDLVNFLRFKMH